MRRLITILLVLGLAFYGGWPAYSGIEIKSALEAKDPARLAAKVDFPSVRESLRPAVTAKVDELLSQLVKKASVGTGNLLDQVKAQVSPKIVEAALNTLVTPETLIRIHASGGTFKDSFDRVVGDEVTKSGGLGAAGTTSGSGAGGVLGNIGKAAEKLGIDPGKALGGTGVKRDPVRTVTDEPAKTAEEAPRYGLDNIKHFGLDGPFTLSLGVAKDPKAEAADVTAVMSFIGGDWKLSGLVPRS